ncbi:BQ5605_C005g03331 [Microbotryum silenes-dioicae]|uniref:BQ5605_C005g03331 protein n=1 Tax=Microbotryum silenes-dioicae TaxID=796604 RepID=A0A2X0MDP3_9BASI|nr:BQ5605_C005g03331 [Microbotryum silenes-dioicae]
MQFPRYWGDLLVITARISSDIDQWPCVASDVLDMSSSPAGPGEGPQSYFRISSP